MASSRRLRALITNDDGIDGAGLHALAAAAVAGGFEVTVAAPHVDSSGVGGSIQAVRTGRSVQVHPRTLPGLPDVPAWAVEGHPAFIVSAVLRGWLPRPDVVLSGINMGANTGRQVLHSGTVSAALTAANHGCRALAVSLDTTWQPPDHPNWASAVALLPDVIDMLLAAPEATVFSLNVPDLPLAEIGPLREARLATTGLVQVRIDQKLDGESHVLEASFSAAERGPEPGTDTFLLREGHPTLTELRSVAEVPGVLAEAPAQ